MYIKRIRGHILIYLFQFLSCADVLWRIFYELICSEDERSWTDAWRVGSRQLRTECDLTIDVFRHQCHGES